MLDREHNVVGYEFTIGGGGKVDSVAVLLEVLAGLDLARLISDKIAVVTLSAEHLGNPLLGRLPAKGMLIMVRAQDGNPAEITARMQDMSLLGFRVGLDSYAGTPQQKLLLSCVSHARLNLQAHNAFELSRLATEILEQGVDIIAAGVSTPEDYQMCGKLPFSLLQGYYFLAGKASEDKRISAERQNVVSLLNLVRTEAPMQELEKLFRHDPGLSYRLLRYINSPACGLSREIQSMAQAIMVIGHKQLYRWLTLLLFTNDYRDERSKPLLSSALVRGRFIELIGQKSIEPKWRDGLFIVGVFSCLDKLLGMSMEKAVEGISLSAEVKHALLHSESPYTPYLELVESCEAGRVGDLSTIPDSIALDPREINAIHLEALAWASEAER
jgi:EAL and modified HD-GYP domain-containing signal transduction protein